MEHPNRTRNITRPEWALFMAQDNTGLWAWFSHRPKLDPERGVWVADKGRALVVKYRQGELSRADGWATEGWANSARKLD